MACTHAMGIIITPEHNSQEKNLGGCLFIQQSLFKRVSRSAAKEETYTAKTGNINGSVKNHCASLDCCVYHLCSLLLTQTILTEENKLARLEMALHFRDPKDPTKYQDMHDQIHLDEKWFFLMQEKEVYLLLPEEKNPKHCIKHKLHITKVMFLSAVVRPHYNPCAISW